MSLNGSHTHKVVRTVTLNRRLSMALVLGLLVTSACTHLPQDPEKTLQRVQQTHIVRIGVVESPPWIIRTAGQPEGVEVELVREFARVVSAAPQWFWDASDRHMEALEHYQLDLVIANLDTKTPWKKSIGLTPPYYDERDASLPGSGNRRVDRKHVMAVPPGENGWLERLGNFLQQHKSEVQPMLQRAGANS